MVYLLWDETRRRQLNSRGYPRRGYWVPNQLLLERSSVSSKETFHSEQTELDRISCCCFCCFGNFGSFCSSFSSFVQFNWCRQYIYKNIHTDIFHTHLPSVFIVGNVLSNLSCFHLRYHSVSRCIVGMQWDSRQPLKLEYFRWRNVGWILTQTRGLHKLHRVRTDWRLCTFQYKFWHCFNNSIHTDIFHTNLHSVFIVGNVLSSLSCNHTIQQSLNLHLSWFPWFARKAAM